MTEATTVDPMEAVANAVVSLVDTQREHNEAVLTELRAMRPVETPAAPQRDPSMLPGGATISATDTMRDAFTRDWWNPKLTERENILAIRANFEMAKAIQGASRTMKNPTNLKFREDFENAARFSIFEDKRTERVMVVDGYDSRGLPITRAMDSAETGFGLELIGVEYASQLWQAARNLDTLVGDIRVVPMSTSTAKVPIDGNVPEMVFVGENTSAANTLPTTQKTPSNNVTLTAKKFAIYQVWSAELEEDSVIAFVPFLRDMLAQSAAVHLGSAYLNGDNTNAGTGNINLDDADPADTKHYLAWDGIRHDWIVTTTGNGVNQAGALDPNNINVIRGRLNGGDDDVDNAITNINWGLNPRNLRLVCDWDTYLNLLNADKVTTVDKYGAAATVLTGELGSIYGIPIISPPYATKTEADGKASTTEASNTKGQITLFAPAAYLGGERRGIQMFMDRIQGRDQFLIELYTRRAFTRFGTNGAAGVYNITV